MNLFAFFFPQVIADVYSSINGRIKVIRHGNSIYLSVEDLAQSGGLVKNIWDHALKKIHNLGPKIQNSLVLGVGGGTVISLLNQYFPDTKITGIEIDETMIQLGHKYLHLNDAKNTKIIIADAYTWLTDHKSEENKYDLILVDMYIGRHVPVELGDLNFIRILKSHLSQNGLIIFNRLRNKDNKKEIEDFIFSLKKLFSSVSVEKPIANYLIFCR